MSVEPGEKRSGTWTARLVLAAVVVGILVLFIAENFVRVEVRLILVRVETRLAWSLLLAGLLGLIAGVLIPRLRR